MDIPETAADLTPRWLTDALREGDAIGDAVVSAAEAEQIAVGQGFIGRVFRVRLGYEGPAPGAPASIVVKLPAIDRELRVLLEERGMGATEVGFYRDLAPEVGLPTSRMHYARHDAAGGSYVLLLEDLAPAPIGDSAAGLPAGAGGGAGAATGEAPRPLVECSAPH